MSLHPNAQSTGRAVRNTAFALAAGATLLTSGFSGKAQAADFTQEQCRLVAAVAGKVMKTVGSPNLSVDFRTSLVNFIMPDHDGKGRK